MQLDNNKRVPDSSRSLQVGKHAAGMSILQAPRVWTSCFLEIRSAPAPMPGRILSATVLTPVESYFGTILHSIPVMVLLNRPEGNGASRFQVRKGPSLVILPVVFAKRPVPAVASSDPSAWKLPVNPATNFGRVGHTACVYRMVNEPSAPKSNT